MIGAENVKKIAEASGAKAGDLVVAVSAREQITGTEAAALMAGQLRLQLAETLDSIEKTHGNFCGSRVFRYLNGAHGQNVGQRATSLHRDRR